MGQYQSTQSYVAHRSHFAQPSHSFRTMVVDSTPTEAVQANKYITHSNGLTISDYQKREQDPDVASFKLAETELKKNPENVFQIVSKLGEGSYGSVHKAVHQKTKQVLAIKKVPLDTDLQEIIKEITIMQQCDSSFVVKYYGSYFENSDLWIVMEYCGAGSVSDIMRLRRQTLNELEMGPIIRDTLMGLDYLHSLKKIHRDIKAGNILLNVQGHAKLADFGVAGQLTDTIVKRNTVIGTPFWISPEVIQEIGYDTKADIWSLGITAIEMAEGRPPHADMHPMRAIFIIPTEAPPALKQPDKWSNELNDFVAHCLVKKPEERTAAAALLKHNFIRYAEGPDVVKRMIEHAQQVAEKYAESESNIVNCETEDSSTLIRRDTAGHTMVGTMSNMDEGTMVQHKTSTTGVSSKSPTVMIGSTLPQHSVTSQIGPQYKSASPGSFLPPPAYEEHLQLSKHAFNQNAENFGKQASYATADGPIGAGDSTMSSATSEPDDSTWAYGTFGTPLRRLIEFPNDYNYYRSLTTNELIAAKEQLETAMDEEIKALQARYHLKRKAILDAIEWKKSGVPAS